MCLRTLLNFGLIFSHTVIEIILRNEYFNHCTVGPFSAQAKQYVVVLYYDGLRFCLVLFECPLDRLLRGRRYGYLITVLKEKGILFLGIL